MQVQAMTEMKIQNSQKPTNEISSHSHIYIMYNQQSTE